jgi:hypothetical protein
MWYSKFVKEAYTAWDILSSKEISWQGSFSKSLSDAQLSLYSPTKAPTMSALHKFIESIVKSKILEKYLSEPKSEVITDVYSFIRGLIAYIDAYLKKGNLDTDLLYILDFMGTLNQFLSTKSKFYEVEIGSYTDNPDNVKSAFSGFMSYGYTTINLLMDKGIKLTDSTGMFIVGGRDKGFFGATESESRNKIIQKCLSNNPKLENFTDIESVKQLILSGNYLWTDLKSYISSGIELDEVFEVFETTLQNNFEYALEIISNYELKYYVDFYSRVQNDLEFDRKSDVVQKMIVRIYNEGNKDSITEENIAFLENDDNFQDYCREKLHEIKFFWLQQGFCVDQVLLDYLEDNPEDFEKIPLKILNQLGATRVQQIVQKGKEAKQQILNDGLKLLLLAKKEGVVEIKDAFSGVYNYAYDASYKAPTKLEKSDWDKKLTEEQKEYDKLFTEITPSYFDRMSSESKYTTISPENLKKYASSMVIIEFDGYSLKSFLDKHNAKKLKVNGISFTDGSWRGLFCSQFPNPVTREIVPAILINTSSYDSLEYHRQLAQSLDMSAPVFTEGTRRHEVAHALHYLASGNLIMRESIELNPELTKEEAYIVNPSEMYARTHGDIPYLKSVFEKHLKSKVTSPKIFEAAKEQWIHDIQNEMVHLMSGGTNARRLLNDLEQGRFGTYTTKDGITVNIEDPQGAINKILQRQRTRLELIFHETFSVAGRQDFRRNLIKRKNQLNKLIQSTDIESAERTEMEMELRQIEADLINSGARLVFDLEDVSEAVIEGYMADYFGKIANAVANGDLDSDLVNIDGLDQMKEKETVTQAKPEPPTAKDILDITRFQIQQSKPIPSGRKYDVIMPVHKGPGRPPGNFPGFDDNEPQQGVDVSVQPKDPVTSNGWYGNLKKSIK